MVACCLSACRSFCSFVCQHNLGIESVSAPPRPLRRQTVCHNKWNGASQAAPSRGRRVLRASDNPEAIPEPKNRERMSLATFYYDVETGAGRSTRCSRWFVHRVHYDPWPTTCRCCSDILFHVQVNAVATVPIPPCQYPKENVCNLRRAETRLLRASRSVNQSVDGYHALAIQISCCFMVVRAVTSSNFLFTEDL